MQASLFLKASAANGVVTIISRYHHKKLVLLGASCESTLRWSDGASETISFMPSQPFSVVALGLVDVDNQKVKTVAEAYLLGIKREANGKVTINLEIPVSASAHGVGQMIVTEQFFYIRLCRRHLGADQTDVHSKKWSVGPEKVSVVDKVDPNEICRLLAEPPDGNTPAVEAAEASVVA